MTDIPLKCDGCNRTIGTISEARKASVEADGMIVEGIINLQGHADDCPVMLAFVDGAKFHSMSINLPDVTEPRTFHNVFNEGKEPT